MASILLPAIISFLTAHYVMYRQLDSSYQANLLNNVFIKINSTINWLERQLQHDDYRGTRNKYIETEIFSRVNILKLEVIHYYSDIKKQEDDSIDSILTEIMNIDITRNGSNHHEYTENILRTTALLYSLEEQLRKDMKLSIISSSCRPVLTGITVGAIIMIIYLFIIAATPNI